MNKNFVADVNECNLLKHLFLDKKIINTIQQKTQKLQKQLIRFDKNTIIKLTSAKLTELPKNGQISSQENEQVTKEYCQV